MKNGKPVPMPNRSELKIAAALFILFACLYAINSSGHPYTIDGWANTVTAESLALKGSFDVGPLYGKTIVGVGIETADGRYFSKYSPLLPLLMAPLAKTGALLAPLAPPGSPGLFTVMFATSFTNGLITAAAVAVLFLLCVSLGISKRFSVATAAVFGLATIAAPYAKMCLPDPLAALTTTAAFLGVVRYGKTGAPRWLAFAAVAAALIPLSRLSAVISIIPIVIYAAAGPRALRNAAATAAGAAVGLAVHAIFNYYRFGSFLETGYGAEATTTNLSHIAALYGLLLSSDKSFFVYSPILILFIPGLCIGFRRGLRAEMTCIAALFAINVLFYSIHLNWAGGNSWGPRYLVSIVPVCAAAAGVFIESRWRRPVWKTIIILLLAISAAVQFSAVSVKYFPHYVNDGVRYDIEKAAAEGRLFKPGAPRFLPLRAQFADTSLHYKYTFSHLSEYFGAQPEYAKTAAEKKLIKMAPDFWGFLVSADTGAKLRAAMVAVLLIILAVAIISARSLCKNLNDQTPAFQRE